MRVSGMCCDIRVDVRVTILSYLMMLGKYEISEPKKKAEHELAIGILHSDKRMKMIIIVI